MSSNVSPPVGNEVYKNASQALINKGDSLFCVPLALGLVSGREPEEIAQIMEANGRRKRNAGCRLPQVLEQAKELGLVLIDRIAEVKACGARTVAALPQIVDSKKKYLVGVRGHVLAVIYGEVQDWTANKKNRVSEFYEIQEGTLGTLKPIEANLKMEDAANNLLCMVKGLLPHGYASRSGSEVRIQFREGTCYIRQSKAGYTVQYGRNSSYFTIAPRNRSYTKLTSQFANYEYTNLEDAITQTVAAID